MPIVFDTEKFIKIAKALAKRANLPLDEQFLRRYFSEFFGFLQKKSQGQICEKIIKKKRRVNNPYNPAGWDFKRR